MSEALGPPISFFCPPPPRLPSCSIAFLKGVKRCSEANAAKTPLPFLSKSQNESAAHVRGCNQTSRPRSRFFGPSLGDGGRRVDTQAGKGEGSHCFSGNQAARFSFGVQPETLH